MSPRQGCRLADRRPTGRAAILTLFSIFGPVDRRQSL